jgi:hypothetical protein
LIQDELKRRFYRHARVKARLPIVQEALLRGEITAVRAAESLLSAQQENPPAPTGTTN